MAQIKINEKDIFSELLYLAVPILPSPFDLVSEIDILQKDLFEFPAPEKTDALRAYVKDDSSFSEVVIRISNWPNFDPKIYQLDGIDLLGKTTFHLSLIGNSENYNDILKRKVLGKFPGYVDLPFQPEVEYKLSKIVFNEKIKNFQCIKPFFNIHTNMAEFLNKPRKLPIKKLTNGFIVASTKAVLKKTFPKLSSNIDLRLVMRIQGYNQDYPFETAGIYLGHKGIESGIYGNLIMKKFEEKCQCPYVDECDQAKFFAGYLFNPKNLFYGMTISKSDLHNCIVNFDDSLAPLTQIGRCLTMIQYSEKGINNPKYDRAYFNQLGIDLNYESILSMHKVAELAYKAKDCI